MKDFNKSTVTEDKQLTQMRDLACILHSTYYGVLNALKKEKGLFSICELSIKGIDDILKVYFNFLENKSIQEIITSLENTGIYNKIKLVRNQDSFFLDIGDCLFAGGESGVHKKIKDIDMPCPVALFISACIAKENPTKKMYIYPSEYFEDGVKTQFDLLSIEEYTSRMNELQKIIKT